jgi:MFS family permease
MSTVAAKSMKSAWMVVALLWFVACLNYLDRNMITTMRPSLLKSIPMTEAQFGLVTSIFLWVYGLLSPVAGFLADRLPRSRVIVGSLLIWSLVTWLTSYATTFEYLLITRALMGASEACYIPAALALITDYHGGNTRSKATGLHMTGISAGSALGGMGGWMAANHSWNFAFTFFGIVGVVYSIFLAFFLRDAKPEAAPTVTGTAPAAPEKVQFGAALVSLCRSPGFIMMIFYWGFLGIAGWSLVGWMPTYLHERFHLPQSQAGFYATISLHIAAPIGLVLGGALADYWGKRNERGRVLVPVIGLCAATPAVILVAESGLLPVVIGGLVVYGVMRAFTDANNMPILCLISDPRYRATGYGVLNLFSTVIGGLGIYAGGVLRDAKIDISNIFLFSALCLVLCAALLFMVRPDPKIVANEGK